MQPHIGKAGELYSTVAGSGSFTLHSDLGLGINASVRPCFAQLGNATIITGKYSRAVVFYDDLDAFYPAGIAAPLTKPSVATGGAGNVTGDVVYYYTFVHETAGVKRAESNPSPASDTLSTTDNSVDLSSIAGSADAVDTRVNKVYIYSSRDGSIPRKVGSISLGTTTFTDNQSDDFLAEQIPLPVKSDADGVTILDDGARGIPPYTEICFTYDHRIFYGRDPDHKSYVWFSLLDEGEGVNLTVTDPHLPPLGALKTKGGQGVRGFGVGRDELMVGHQGGWDGIQGTGPTSFTVRQMVRRYAPLNHFGITLIGDGVLAWPAKEGGCAYDGSFRNLMADSLRAYWVAAYKANPAAYQDSVGADNSDGDENVWELLIPISGGPSRKYILHYDILFNGGPPVWTFDQETREVVFIGNLAVSATTKDKQIHYSAADGFIRKGNIKTDNDDDGDAGLKRMEVWTKAFLPRGSQGGDDGHGVAVDSATFFVRNENTAVDVAMFGGDDEAYTKTPSWTETIPASAQTYLGSAASAKTSHHFGQVSGVAGKMVLAKVAADSPDNVEVRGLEFNVKTGSGSRP